MIDLLKGILGVLVMFFVMMFGVALKDMGMTLSEAAGAAVVSTVLVIVGSVGMILGTLLVFATLGRISSILNAGDDVEETDIEKIDIRDGVVVDGSEQFHNVNFGWRGLFSKKYVVIIDDEAPDVKQLN